MISEIKWFLIKKYIEVNTYLDEEREKKEIERAGKGGGKFNGQKRQHGARKVGQIR